jgi:hypothetical protein
MRHSGGGSKPESARSSCEARLRGGPLRTAAVRRSPKPRGCNPVELARQQASAKARQLLEQAASADRALNVSREAL